MRRILVILPSWVGDVCMATPVLRYLAAQHPNCELVLFGRPMLAELVAGLPWVHSFLPGSMRGSAAISELRTIRRARCDALLVLPNSFRSALFGRFTAITERVGRARDGRSLLLTRALGTSTRVHSAVDDYADLAQWWVGAPLTDRRLELAVTDEDKSKARTLLGESATHEPLKEGPRSLILLNPGANRPDKRWSAGSFARAALEIQAVHRSAGIDSAHSVIAVTGNRSESSLCAQIAKECGAIDLCAQGISLGSLKAILTRTMLLITNDTGPRAMAAALETPTVALFGPTDCRFTPLDYPLERRLVAEPFLTADRIADDHKPLCAIDRISVGDVVAAARSLDARLAPSAPSPASRVLP